MTAGGKTSVPFVSHFFSPSHRSASPPEKPTAAVPQPESPAWLPVLGHEEVKTTANGAVTADAPRAEGPGRRSSGKDRVTKNELFSPIPCGTARSLPHLRAIGGSLSC